MKTFLFFSWLATSILICDIFSLKNTVGINSKGKHTPDLLSVMPCRTTCGNNFLGRACNNLYTDDTIHVKVSPNPCSNYFRLNIQSKIDAPLSMQVNDAFGKMVDRKSGISPNSSFEIGYNYSGGIYFAEFIQGDHHTMIKLIKIK